MSKKKYGPWETVEQIGEGGMGHVFLVRNVNTDAKGALKRLKNSNRKERFKSEVEAVKTLNHPGIVPLLDFDHDAEVPYAVYEHEEGGSLGDMSIDELLSIPIDQRLLWCDQICDVLSAMHKSGLVHRDIKPDNILISTDRKTVRLCDFGLVYFDDAGERQTESMEQVGSRYYIAPESEAGFADKVVPASDIYSLGKMLYYIITGNVFSRERHREEAYDLAKKLNNPYLESISRILDTALSIEIKSRPDATMFRIMVSSARSSISQKLPVPGVIATYGCVFCGVGQYKLICGSTGSECHNQGYGEGNVGNEQMVFAECDNCGNCQRFKLKYDGKLWFPVIFESEARRGFQPRGFG